MSNEKLTIFYLIAQYIPNEYRIKFLEKLLETYGSIYKLSKVTKISRPTLYRYFIHRKGYPNDIIMAEIIKHLTEIKRTWTKEQLRQLARDFNELINKI